MLKVKYKPDYNEAENFLTLLDPFESRWIFQGFNDDLRKGASRTTKIAKGTLKECWPQLCDWNKRRYSVTVMVNKTDGEALDKSHISKIRTIFRELDEPTDSDPIIAPSLVVQTSASKYKIHEYFLIDDEDPISIEEADALLGALVDLGGDKNARDTTRKLRLPGFLHQKIHPRGVPADVIPFQTRLIGGNYELYTRKELLRRFHVVTPGKLKKQQTMEAKGFDKESGVELIKIEESEPWKDPVMAMRIRHYLEGVDPDCSRDDWKDVAFALKEQSYRDQEDYFELFHEWSEMSGSYLSMVDDRKVWRSAKVNMLNGVRFSKLKWLAYQREEEEAEDPNIKKKYIATPRTHQYIKAINDGWVTLVESGKRLFVQGWNTEQREVHNAESARLELARHTWQFLDEKGNFKDQDPFKAWVSSGTMMRLKGQKYIPGVIHGIWHGYLNTFPGWADHKGGNGIPDKFYEHLKRNVCSGRGYVYEWLLDWMAHMLQKPTEKPGTALVVQGNEGTGKSILKEVIELLIGEDNAIAYNSMEALTSQFNAQLTEKLVVFADEAVWGGGKHQRGILYALITDKVIQANEKFRAQRRMESYCRLIVATNEDWAVPTTMNARRFLVLRVGDGNREDFDFFEDMMQNLRKGGAKRLFKDLMKRKIKNNIRQPPSTKERAEQKAYSMSSVGHWWVNCVEEGLIDGSMIEGWPEKIEIKEFYSAYQSWGKLANERYLVKKGVPFKQALKPFLPDENYFRSTRLKTRWYELQKLSVYRKWLRKIRVNFE